VAFHATPLSRVGDNSQQARGDPTLQEDSLVAGSAGHAVEVLLRTSAHCDDGENERLVRRDGGLARRKPIRRISRSAAE
jgi:hypothetical protein